MRKHRILIGSVAVMTLGIWPVAGPATAAELPERTVTATVVDKGAVLVLKGRVRPDYRGRHVIVQRKKCRDECSWTRWARVRTSDTGRYRSRITAPRKGYWYWRAKVRKDGEYRTSFSPVWRSFTS